MHYIVPWDKESAEFDVLAQEQEKLEETKVPYYYAIIKNFINMSHDTLGHTSRNHRVSKTRLITITPLFCVTCTVILDHL